MKTSGLRRHIRDALDDVNYELGKEPSRELSLVKTKLEEAYLWMNESEDRYLAADD